MTQGKGTYSLISVDVAPDEEVVRVDANGVHREGGTHAATDSSQRAGASSNDDGQQALEGRSSSEAGNASRKNAGEEDEASASSRVAADSDSYDGRDDLEGPVPMAGMQRIIIVAVVVCLIAFIVYFAVSHG